MKKALFWATLAVAIVAGACIFASCSNGNNANKRAVLKTEDGNCNMAITDEEFANLMENCDVQVMVADSGCTTNTFFFQDEDYRLLMYSEKDSLVSNCGLCYYYNDAEIVLKRIDDKSLKLYSDDFTEPVEIADVQFDKSGKEFSFTFKLGGKQYDGAFIVSKTYYDEFAQFMKGTKRSLSDGVKLTLGNAFVTFVVGNNPDVMKKLLAKDCMQSFEICAKECITHGGTPHISHKHKHNWCTFDCQMSRPADTTKEKKVK
ncbi:MAG: hypothetical protein J6T33_00010 [Bacteroidales bacterium]|nr:hypothetical protein [Bacteroidales bacterium]